MNFLRRAYSAPALENASSVIVKSIIQRNPILLQDKSDFEMMYMKYCYDVLEKEESRGSAKMSVPMKPKSDAEIEQALERERILQDTQRRKLVEFDSNLQSLNRKPKEKLYLVVKGRDQPSQWRLPCRTLSSAESESVPHLHGISEQIFRRTLGESCDFFHVSKRPVASLSQPNENIFYFRSQLLAPTRCQIPKEEIMDIAWLTKHELGQALSSPEYNAIKDALLD